MSVQANVAVMGEIFGAIERRDEKRVVELFDPEIVLHWPPSLPYGGTVHGLKPRAPTWADTWNSLQPTEMERRMDPRVVGATEDEVVVLWQQRAVSPAGETLETPVLGLYRVRNGKLARAQMFYFDPAAVNDFLARAHTRAQADSAGEHRAGVDARLEVRNTR